MFHNETIKKCLENYKIYAMETKKFEQELNDLDKFISNLYQEIKYNVKKQNTVRIQAMKEAAYNEYKSILKKV